MATFVVRRKTAGGCIDGRDLAAMVERGLVKFAFNEANESVIVPRLPELLASEIAFVLAQELAHEIGNNGPKAAGDWLVEQTSSLPLGDLIGAQALWDCAEQTRNVPINLIEQLLTARPRRTKVAPGTRAAMHIPGAGLIDLTFRADGTVLARAGRNQRILEADDEDAPHEMYADVESWLILSHVAGRPFVVESADGTMLGRADYALLLEIGTCPIVLRRPVADPEMNGILTHDFKEYGSFVCHKAGIVEPITLSILKFLDSAGEMQTQWINEAVERNSLPLLSRVDIALRHIAERGDTREGRWARQMLDQVIRPAFDRYPPLH